MLGVSGRSGERENLVVGGQHRPRVPENQRAERREDNCTRAVAFEDGAAHDRLGALDLCADGGLGQAKLAASL